MNETMPDKVEMTITPEHLDRAIEAKRSPSYYVLKQCMVGQAAQDTFGDKFRSCSHDTICCKEASVFYTNEQLIHFVSQFDMHMHYAPVSEYDELRNQLPITLQLERNKFCSKLPITIHERTGPCK